MSVVKIQKLQKYVNSAIILSEASHIFCCVLPTVFSIVSLLAGLGMISAMPYWLQGVHDVMHKWEVPMIGVAGVVIALGWLLNWMTLKLDAHSEHCHHGGCTPKKQKSANMILKVATVLFLVNIAIYFGFHRNLDMRAAIGAAHEEAAHEHHDH